ncbi:diguanylate cyclase (GGDEF)-like protein [Rhodococcus sp. 27YEA15]|uniref:putative bifunctional diguanylate cyclase/phosphodiesterase n=1 Tax=Rhodococcus sp. 27YEA15 TaxID=3156259 RepID=UPI003C7E3E11
MTFLDHRPMRCTSTDKPSDVAVAEPAPASVSRETASVLDLLPHPVWVGNAATRAGYSNKAWREYTGSLEAHTTVEDILHVVHPSDIAAVYTAWQEAQERRGIVDVECRLRHHCGYYRWFSITAKPESFDDQLSQWSVTFVDVDEHVSKMRSLSEQLQKQNNMLDVSVDCIKILHVDGRLSHMNKSGYLAFGIPPEVNIAGLQWLDLLPKEVRAQGRKALGTALDGRNARFMGMSIAPGQKPQHWDNILTPMKDDDGTTSGILCVSRNVTPQREAELRLRIASERDELTGLHNRRSFNVKLKQFLGSSHREAMSVGLMLVDLDHFKHVNDTLGHPAGDHLLRILSRRLSACLPANSYVARLGGDEFAILIGDVQNEAEFLAAAEQVLTQIHAPITYGGKVVNGGMSIGCAVYPRDAQNAANLMKCADTALNDLKAGGRGGIRMFSTTMLADAERTATQLRNARQIVRDDAIEPYYQPKVRLDDGSIVGFEALLRWRSPCGDIQAPDSVAEAFNDHELAAKISDLMQIKVFADMSRWMESGVTVLPVSLNASPVEFLRDNYAERLLRRLEHFRIPLSLVEVEITEHFLGERGSEYVVRALRKLKRSGVRITLDDFGTGHSSFTHLRDYPVDSLKIDCDFVRRLSEEPFIAAIVQAIVHLGPILALDVVAEGIETDEQRQVLLDLGCEIGQGYLFSKAVDADSVERMLVDGGTAVFA